MFKIVDRATGLFSMGGMVPYWTKNGKVWKTEGHLKSHLKQITKPYPNSCFVIEYEMVLKSHKDLASYKEKENGES